MSDIFNEVDEEVRKDAYLQLWKRYGWHMIAVVAVLLVAAAGYVGWEEWQKQQAQERAQGFSAALDLAATGQEDAAISRFADMAKEGDGYGILAAFEEAKLRRQAGDEGGAIEIYDRVAADADAPDTYRDMATVLSVMLQVDQGNAGELDARLQPLTAAGEPFRYTALELSALVALRDGRAAQAQEIYADLADDAEAPQGLRTRAAEMASALEG